MEELDGKVAVITGGASGIGHALATHCATAGMKLVLADIDVPSLDAAVAGFAAGGAEVIGVPTDVTDRDAVFALAARAVDEFGTVHLAVNNAGVSGGAGPSWEISAAAWEWTIGVDLMSVVHGIAAFVPILLEQDEGHVVNTASLAGLIAMPFLAPYTAAKHAVLGMSESLFHELAALTPNVGVSVLCPAFLRTRIADSARHFPGPASDLVTAGRDGPDLGGIAEQLVQSGGDPADYTARVLEAVRTRRFMVVTDEEEAVAVIRSRAHLPLGSPPRFPRPG